MTPEFDDPVYLTLSDVLTIYAAAIGLTVEQAEDHLRDSSALQGALARPAAYGHYQAADIALQATVLAHGIAETQPFVDGNKRTALITMLTFLEINGWVVSAADRELADWIISFGRGEPPEAVAKLLRGRLRPVA